MNPNNSEFIVEDALNESDFTAVSSIGADIKKIAEKIQKLEDMAMKNSMGGSSSNVDQSGMIQIGWKMGEKFGELKKENEGLKDGMKKMMKAIEELKEIVGKLGEENGKLNEENDELKDGMKKMKEELEGIKVENVEKSHEIERMKKAIEELKEENERKLSEMAELIAQIGGKNAKLEGKIEEIPKVTVKNGGVEWIKYDSNKYRLDSLHCGSQLTISEEGLEAKHSSPYSGWNCVLANLPIPSINLNGINKPRIAFYFEVHILKSNGIGTEIGFCVQQIPLECIWLGQMENSIGIYGKGGIRIDGIETKFGNADGDFKEGDFVGIGIILKPNFKMECFATLNGQLLGKAEIPPKFANFQLFPAINIFYNNQTIRANFDKDNCQFKEFERALQ